MVAINSSLETPGRKDKTMYRIWFSFKSEFGDRVRDYLDNNGNGYAPLDALDISRQLKAQGNTEIQIVRIGSIADREEARQ